MENTPRERPYRISEQEIVTLDHVQSQNQLVVIVCATILFAAPGVVASQRDGSLPLGSDASKLAQRIERTITMIWIERVCFNVGYESVPNNVIEQHAGTLELIADAFAPNIVYVLEVL